MTFQDLFKTREQRANERKVHMRKALRKLDMATEQANGLTGALKQKCLARRAEAYNFLKAGQRRQAEAKMAEFRTFETLLSKQEKKCWLIEYYKTQVESAEADNSFAAAMIELFKVVQIEPAKIETMFSSVDNVLDGQSDIDSIFDAVYKEQTAKGAVSFSSSIPSLDKMMEELEKEVAIDVGGGKIASNDLGVKTAPTLDEIDKLLEEGDRT